MSWTYAGYYVVEFVTAPTFMAGIGLGAFLVGVVVLCIYGPEMDRLREVIRGQVRELELVAPNTWESPEIAGRWLHVQKVAPQGSWLVTVTDERDRSCRSAILTTAMTRSLREWLNTELEVHRP